MFTVYTDTTLIAPNIEDLDVARATAEQFASTGYTAYIRDDSTGAIVATVEVPARELGHAHWLDYANEHPNYHPASCVPYTDHDCERFLIMNDGKPQAIYSPETISVNGDELCDFESDLAFLAELVNPHDVLYREDPDEKEALKYMHETGCFDCPFRLECDFMRSEIENT